MTVNDSVSARKGRVSALDGRPYEWLETEDLVKLTTTRGLGITKTYLVNLLKEQDHQHSRCPFRFMSLPAELRNMVYGYVCADYHSGRRIRDEYGYEQSKRNHFPALTRVSKQVRKECLAVLFDSDSVQLSAEPRRQHVNSASTGTIYNLKPSIMRLLEYRSPHLALYRSVRVDFVLDVADAEWDYTIFLYFKRNVNASPQYSIVCDAYSDGFETLSWYEEEPPEGPYMNDEFRRATLNYYDQMETYIEQLAQLAFKNRLDTFNFSAPEINNVLKRLPTSIRRSDMEALQGGESALRKKLNNF
ncbi:hypothetical protein MBLNU457_g0336t1 [Dothideomycetes sp. NU457]